MNEQLMPARPFLFFSLCTLCLSSSTAIADDWRKPLKLQFRQTKVLSSGGRREESQQGGLVEGIVRGLRREAE